MFRRYLKIAVLIFSLIGAYFLFFYNNDESEYLYYLNKLYMAEEYASNIGYLDLLVNKEENSYIFTFENPSKDLNNLKILVVDADNSEFAGVYPSFGIITHQNYDLKQQGETNGINLVLQDYEFDLQTIKILISYNSTIDYFIIELD